MEELTGLIFRILQVIAWPTMWFGLGLGIYVFWKLQQRTMWERARAEHLQQLINVELMVERRKKQDGAYVPPAWYPINEDEATT